MTGLAERWELVVGLEVHAQLSTRTKLFSPMTASYGAEPNTQVNEICAGLPGVLPVLNAEAVRLAVRAGLALECEIARRSVFARKNYFYPDLPKGYQISQFEAPLCLGGLVRYELDGEERTCRLTRIHVEEDAGKSIHAPGSAVTQVDLNRAGVPLLEIVSEPDLRTPDEAVAYLKELRNVLVYLGVCDGNMEEGSLRCDANVSVRRRGETALGTKVELKNLNSFKFIKDALAFEWQRQADALEHGEPIVQETRLWRTDARRSESMRRKEGSDDYRYFPDPDLPPLELDPAFLEAVRAAGLELPWQRRQRYVADLGLPRYDAGVLTASRALADYFEEALRHHDNAKGLSNWLMTAVLAQSGGEAGLETFSVRPAQLAELVRLVDEGAVTGPLAKRVFAAMVETGQGATAVIDAQGLRVERDEGALAGLIDRILAENPGQVAELRAGKAKVRGYLVGQIMRASQGKADPKLVQQLLDERLAQ
jgi:aspartyl-tRNA(Asn)/glutamyl-tRNA(Gln) amidotransferase subunit B